jgi:two-component system chemotaxis response regulator CheB
VRRVRVLVVDDSAVIRKLLADAITAQPDLELAGSAPNGQVALERLEQAAPDVVTLDVEMPVLDGIATLKALKRVRPRLPVLMLSSHTERGALATLDALAHGASDFVAKPSTGGPDEARAFLDREVLPRLRALAGKAEEAARLAARPPGPAAAPRPPAPRPAARVDAVVLAVSTGGPQALEQVIPRLPRDLPVPVLIVQHMPTLFTRLLAERLGSLGGPPVEEVTSPRAPLPGRCYLATGGRHLVVEAGEGGPRLALDDGPPENSCRPAADPLFRSAVRAWDGRLLAVVMTGMGQDGLVGATALKAAGGAVLAQDQATSVVWGMPGAVVKAGLADAVLPLGDLAREIAERTLRGRPVAAARLAMGRPA